MALLLSLAVWYFLLIKLPEHQVIGTAASVMSKEQALDLMHYHCVKEVLAEDGEWYFDRDVKYCKLTRM